MRVLPFDNTKSSMSASELVEEISKKVPRQVQIDILRETFPQGKVTGDLFTIGSTSGESGKSLKIDINPRSPYFMKGQDFNGGVGIGGIVKILMEGRGLRLPEIKEMFSEYVGETRKFVREQPCRESSKNADQFADTIRFGVFVQKFRWSGDLFGSEVSCSGWIRCSDTGYTR